MMSNQKTKNVAQDRWHILTIDLQELTIFELDVHLLFTLVGVNHQEYESYIDHNLIPVLIEKKYLVENDQNMYVYTNKADYVLRQFVSTKKPFRGRRQPEKKEAPIEIVNKYRNLFKGLKPGSMGDSEGVRQKLSRFMEANPTVTIELILKAVERYLDSLTSYDYLQQADYFIYKRERNGEESSRLSAFIDEVKANLPSENDDWTSRIN